MNKQEAQGFEVAGYSETEFGITEAHKAIVQIFRDLQRDAPAHAVWGDVVGEKLKIHYNNYVMFLPTRMRQIEEEAETVFTETVKYLKKEFKERTGKALKLKEVKEMADRSVEKVSLNERYMYKAWKFYDLDF